MICVCGHDGDRHDSKGWCWSDYEEEVLCWCLSYIAAFFLITEEPW